MIRTPRMAVPAKEKAHLLAEASDPTTPPERLAELSNAADLFVAEAAQSNPNLDDETLGDHLWRGAPAAWCSPATPLWLLAHGGGDDRIVAGANIFVFTRLRHSDPLSVGLEHAFGVLCDWWQRPSHEEAPAKIGYLVTLAVMTNDDALLQQVNQLVLAIVRDAAASSDEVAEALAETLALVEEWIARRLHGPVPGSSGEPQTPRWTENIVWKVIGRLRDAGFDDGAARVEALLRTTFPVWRPPVRQRP